MNTTKDPADPTEKSPTERNRGDAAWSKKLRNEQILGLCKKLCPIPLEKLLSHIELETGLSRGKANSTLMVFYDVGYIDIDQLPSKTVTIRGPDT